MSPARKAFTGGFIFGALLALGWFAYAVASLDAGTSQDPQNIRHLDEPEFF